MTLKTALYDWHVAQGAKMVPFAGYDMPVQYRAGIVQEHQLTRQKAGLFDVSHMGQIVIRGEGIAEALEALLPSDIQGLKVNQQRYSFLMNEQGGIDDDLMVTRREHDFYVVVNAACKDADFKTLSEALPAGSVQWWPHRSLIAVQGPEAVSIVSQLNSGVEALQFMQGGAFDLLGYDCWVSRSGYTGEDGFEISIDDAGVEALCNRLLELGVVPVGLGARDSLRLEAGLCLYGNDINAQTSPIEANLLWAIQKVRRPDGERAGGFRGEALVFKHIQEGAPRKLVGLNIEGKMPVRAHTPIVNANGEMVGEVSSGGFGASVNRPIAMAMLQKNHSEVGTELWAEVRGKRLPVFVRTLPFIQKGYKK